MDSSFSVDASWSWVRRFFALDVECGDQAEDAKQVAGEDRPDSVDRLQRPATLVAAGEATQLAVDRVQLLLQRRHHRQKRVDLQARVLG